MKQSDLVSRLWQRLHENRTPLLLVGLIVASLGLRIWGIRFGLPYRYHIDETFYVAGALRMAGNGFRLPVETHGPNLWYMLLLCEYGVHFVVSWLVGAVDSLAAFEELYRNDPTTFVLLARATSAVFGSATVLPVYLMAREVWDKRIGLVAATFFACTFQHIRESHYGTPDVFSGFLVAWCFVFSLKIVESGRLRDFVLAGLFAGLATGTKFTNGLLAIPVGIAYVSNRLNSGDGSLIARLLSKPTIGVFLGGLVGFATAYPNVLLRPSVFVQYVRFLLDVGANGYGPIAQFRVDAAPAWLYYLNAMTWGGGWPMVVLAAIGLPLVLRRKLAGWILLSFVVPYYALLARSPHYVSRYLIPVVPILCILAALGLISVVNLACSRRQKLTNMAVSVVVAFVVLQPLAMSVRHDVLLTRVDTRTIAKEWIESHIPPGTSVAVDWQKHAPPLRMMEDAFPVADPQYDVMVVNGIGLPEYSLDYYRRAGVEYLILSSYIDDLILTSPADVAVRERFYQDLENESQLVYSIVPYSEDEGKPPFLFDQMFGPVTSLWRFERPGPMIRVYRIE